MTDRSKRKALKLLALNAVATAEQLDDADAMDKASLSAAVDAALGFAPLLSEYFVVRGASSVRAAAVLHHHECCSDLAGLPMMSLYCTSVRNFVWMTTTQ